MTRFHFFISNSLRIYGIAAYIHVQLVVRSTDVLYRMLERGLPTATGMGIRRFHGVESVAGNCGRWVVAPSRPLNSLGYAKMLLVPPLSCVGQPLVRILLSCASHCASLRLIASHQSRLKSRWEILLRAGFVWPSLAVCFDRTNKAYLCRCAVHTLPLKNKFTRWIQSTSCILYIPYSAASSPLRFRRW